MKPTKPALHVSAYDQVSGLLIAVLTGLGLVVALMLVAWWSNRVFLPTPAVPVSIVDVGGDNGNDQDSGPRGMTQDFDEPASSEVPPVVEQKVDSPEAISLAAAEPEVLANLTSGDPDLDGNGLIGNRRKGPPTDKDGIPAWERWEIRFDPQTVAECSRQLDFFQIELAVAGGGNPVVTYVTNVSSPKPTVRTGNPKDEKRLRFMHRSGALREADRKLVQKAAVEPSEKVVFQFYSKQMYETLLLLEHQHKGSRPLQEVRRTIFGVRQTGEKYEFFVIEQEYS